MKIFFLAALLMVSLPARAQTGFDSRNDVSNETRTLTSEALARLRGLDVNFDLLLDRIQSQLPNLKAYLSVEALVATTRSTDQRSIALNFPKLGLVLFDRERWLKIANRDIKRAVALHEVLSLLGLETTGVYLLSNSYLAATGLTALEFEQVLSGVGPETEFSAGRKDERSCLWTGDRSLLLFELWSQGLEACSFNGGSLPPTHMILESQLREVLGAASANCRGDQKVLSVSSKIKTLIGTLKAAAPRVCAR